VRPLKRGIRNVVRQPIARSGHVINEALQFLFAGGFDVHHVMVVEPEELLRMVG
jgi:hypothetical protein